MSKPRLTIAIPSYNRAQKLDNQLGWAVEATAGRWDLCELTVSDNASPDATPQVCEKWQAHCGGRIRVIRQVQNVGLVRNVLACIAAAQGKYVWVVGDDDLILPEAFAWVLDTVQRESPDELGYILLNFRTTDGYAGGTIQERVFPFYEDRRTMPGQALFEECAACDESGLLLISANIYATHLAQAAITRWSGIGNNLAFPLFLSGSVCAQAGMLIRSEPSLIYPHHTGSHLGRWLNTVYKDIPATYLALLNEGYSPGFVRHKILSRASFLAYAARFPVDFVKALVIYLRAARLK